MSNSGGFGGSPYGSASPYAHAEPPVKKSNTAIIIIAILAAVLAISLVICGVLAALLLPAISAARDAARRVQDSNNLKLIGLALHNYHDEYGSFPAAYTVDDQGQPLHSWRVLILPYLEEGPLYERVDLSKPWDSPENAFLMESMPSLYKSPQSPDERAGYTSYHTIELPADPTTGEGGQSLLQGGEWSSFQDVVDGASNTIAAVSLPELTVPWAEPGGLTPDQVYQELSDTQGANFLMADGAVKYITGSVDRQVFDSLVTRDGGESNAGLGL